MQEAREETTLQYVIGDQRHWIQINRYDYLFTVKLIGQDMLGECAYGEGFTLEEAINMFVKHWSHWNECGPY